MIVECEGFEWEAIKGAKKYLRECPPCFLFTEFTPRLMRKYGADPAKLIADIKSFGYKVNFDWDEVVAKGESPTFETNLFFNHERCNIYGISV